MSAKKPLRHFALVGRKHPAISTPARLLDPDELAAPETLEFGERLVRTLHMHPGVGIAACQVGEPISMVATVLPFPADLLPRRRLLANVTVSSLDGEAYDLEGCLTLPGRFYDVPRATHVTVSAFDLDAQAIVTFDSASPFEARLWQHEADHLAGRLIAERFPEIRGRR